MAHTMIEVRDLEKQFGFVKALKGVSFDVPRGQVVGLLGPNGAGKTTAMRIITGFLAPTQGTALVDGHDVVEEPMACRRRIGYLPEGNPLYLELRIEEALKFAARMHGLTGADADRAVRETVETVGLVGRERMLVGTQSKGFKQRVGLAQALLHNPDILILDEPTSGLDPNQQEDMRGLIRRLGEDHTVIISTHILPEVEAVCDRVMIIHQGLLVADESADEIKNRASRGPSAVLVVRGGVDEAREAVGAVEFVGEFEASPLLEAPDHVQIRVGLEEDGRERLEALAAAVVAKGLPLSELRSETASLEQIFAELTSSAATAVEEPEPAVAAASEED